MTGGRLDGHASWTRADDRTSSLTCCGFVQEQDAWRSQQLGGDADPPLLAAGQSTREGVADEAVRDLRVMAPVTTLSRT